MNVAEALVDERHILMSIPIEVNGATYIGAKALTKRLDAVDAALKPILMKDGVYIAEEYGYRVGLKPNLRREADVDKLIAWLSSHTQYADDVLKKILKVDIDWKAFDEEFPSEHPWVGEMKEAGLIGIKYNSPSVINEPLAVEPKKKGLRRGA